MKGISATCSLHIHFKITNIRCDMWFIPVRVAQIGKRYFCRDVCLFISCTLHARLGMYFHLNVHRKQRTKYRHIQLRPENYFATYRDHQRLLFESAPLTLYYAYARAISMIQQKRLKERAFAHFLRQKHTAFVCEVTSAKWKYEVSTIVLSF